MLNKINYIKGDATVPIDVNNTNKLIIHCCNDVGGWGSGFVLALSKKWKSPELEYRKLAETKTTKYIKLGMVQVVPVEKDTFVANMIGQHKTGFDENGLPPVRYEAIRKCLEKVCKYSLDHNCSVHAPRFGSALAGGDWNIIEYLINEELIKNGVIVYIYDFE